MRRNIASQVAFGLNSSSVWAKQQQRLIETAAVFDRNTKSAELAYSFCHFQKVL